MTKKKTHLIESTIRKEAHLNNISKVLVAISGGADSVATTFAIKKAGLDILALHCNFHLRGDESNRDEEFVRTFCTSNDIPLEIKHFDVDRYMQENRGISIEMACRELRYKWFYKKLNETSFDRVVTGHNADDNIETFFMNVLRGSGTRGLKGITKDNGVVWRPLLEFHRKQIIAFIEEYNLSFIVDSSNLGTDFRRNLLRNKIFPLLKEEWKGFDTAVEKTISYMDAENKIVEMELDKNLPQSHEPLPIDTILSFPAPLLLIKRFIDPLKPFTTTAEEVFSAINANKPHIRRWKLKKGELILRNGKLFIEMVHSESRPG